MRAAGRFGFVLAAAATLLAAACGPLPYPSAVEGESRRSPAAVQSGESPAVVRAYVFRETPPLPRLRPPAADARASPTAPGTVTVVRGDTLYGIARRHGVGIGALVRLNGLTPPYRLLVGQRLMLPEVRFHTVRKGETLHGIARDHGVEPGALAKENRIRPPYRVAAGTQLTLPAPVQRPRVARDPSPSPAVAPRRTARPGVEEAAPREVARPAVRPETRQASVAPASDAGFLWPSEGPVISRFGPKPNGMHNDGINIALPVGSAIRASQNGVVAYAGNEIRGYGDLVLLRHDGGWMTAYAHNSELLVEKGEAVKRGQVISRSGASGRVSRPQAHFEIRRNGKPRDPLDLFERE